MLWARALLFGQAIVGYPVSIFYLVRSQRHIRDLSTRTMPKPPTHIRVIGMTLGVGVIVVIAVVAGYLDLALFPFLWPIAAVFALQGSRHPSLWADAHDGKLSHTEFRRFARREGGMAALAVIPYVIFGLWLADQAFPGHGLLG